MLDLAMRSDAPLVDAAASALRAIERVGTGSPAASHHFDRLRACLVALRKIELAWIDVTDDAARELLLGDGGEAQDVDCRCDWAKDPRHDR